MAMAVAASPAISMRAVVLVAALMTVGLGPRVSLAQVRSVANEEVVSTDAPIVSPAAALAEWEDALATRVTDADTWSAIGRRLYDAGQYRECIAAFERSLVHRNRHSPDDARYIAEAYAKLGNLKQAARWRGTATGIALPSHRHSKSAV